MIPMHIPLRVEIEQYLKDHPHLRLQIKEAPKHSYESIIQQIECGLRQRNSGIMLTLLPGKVG